MNIYERGGVYSGSNIFATCDTIWGLMDCSQIAVNSLFPPEPPLSLNHSFTSVSLTTRYSSSAYEQTIHETQSGIDLYSNLICH